MTKRVLTKKVCLVGEFSVGKTSLTRRFVNSVFSEQYLTTVGVAISTKEIEVPSGDIVKLIIWDIAGEENLTEINKNYLLGANGYLLVADGTRPGTLDAACSLKGQVDDFLGDVPNFSLMNKADLVANWSVPVTEEIPVYQDIPWTLTSAKTGENVAEIFFALATLLSVNAPPEN